MHQKTFNYTVGILFSVIFLLHGLRIVYGWPAVIGTVEIAMWVSWLVVIISGFLALVAFKNIKINR